MSKPHKCPVCLGQGKVPLGFYNFEEYNYITTAIVQEVCRSCHGEGVIWEEGGVCCEMHKKPTAPTSNCTHPHVVQLQGGLEKCTICGQTWGQ